jgi:hypothetical protein
MFAVVPTHDHEEMFIGGRFLVGLGFVDIAVLSFEVLSDRCSSNLAQGSAPLLIMELAYPQHRGKLTTM